MSSKLLFPNFQEMLVKKEHGTATESEVRSLQHLSPLLQQEELHYNLSTTPFFPSFFAQLPAFLISVSFLNWPE